MPHAGLYNDNMYRHYPFVPPTVPVAYLPETAVVEFGCIVGLDAGYDDYQHVVYLKELRRIDDTFFFRFASDAPGLDGWHLDFSRPIDAELWTLEESSAAEIPDDVFSSLSGADDLFLDEVRWEGWLATGDMQALADHMAAGESYYYGPADHPVEPALVQNLGSGYVRSINIANAERTKYQPDMLYGCSLSSFGYIENYDTDRYYISRVGMTGKVRLLEGYNCVIRQDTRLNTLTINAVESAGAGVPAEEVKLHPHEKPPEGSRLLSGGPRCDEVLTSVNGLTGSTIKIEAGTGIDIIQDPARPWRIIIDASLRDLTICPSDLADILSSSVSLSLSESVGGDDVLFGG